MFKSGKGFRIKSLPLYVIETRFPEDYLDITQMVKLKMTPAPILWSFEGTYHLVPMQHVADTMDAIRRHLQIEKTPLHDIMISMNDAVALDHDTGWTLSRRPR